MEGPSAPARRTRKRRGLVWKSASGLPEVTKEGHLAGILSRADVLAVFDRPDHEIGEGIRAGLLASFPID